MFYGSAKEPSSGPGPHCASCCINIEPKDDHNVTAAPTPGAVCPVLEIMELEKVRRRDPGSGISSIWGETKKIRAVKTKGGDMNEV